VALLTAAGYDLEAAVRAWDVLGRSATSLGSYRYNQIQSVRQSREEMERVRSGSRGEGRLGTDRGAYDGQLFEILRWLGERMVEERSHGEALTAIDRALRARPDDLKAHYLRGLVLVASARAAEDYRKAIGEFEWVLARNPDQATTHRDLGLSYFLAQQPSSSLAHLRRYLELQRHPADEAEIRKVVTSLEQGVPAAAGEP
jgi:tetratricopeptide (TPR) repeat protein